MGLCNPLASQLSILFQLIVLAFVPTTTKWHAYADNNQSWKASTSDSANPGDTIPSSSKFDDTMAPTGASPLQVSEECRLVMAESTVQDGGWGIFSMVSRKRGTAIETEGDVVIQLTDLNPHHAQGMRRLIWEYLWEGQETGGQYEAKHVMSIAPGVGMLANGAVNRFNILPYKPYVDNAGLDRFHSPGAGAITHYHNYTWFVSKDIDAGEEVFVNYGRGWFKERKLLESSHPPHRSLSELRKNAYCLDNLLPGRSTLDDAGRGAFAARDIEPGSIVAPVPVLPISSKSLVMTKQHENANIFESDQLLRNYCFGHANSTLLLYPYSNMINLINHNSEPNVRLQWASLKGNANPLEEPIESLQNARLRLLLELTATRPISRGEEIFLDYGRAWEEAWEDHIQTWEPPTGEHVSAYAIDAAGGILRTEAEQRTNPYPENIFTSCYYVYSTEQSIKSSSERIRVWEQTSGVFDTRFLRPCAVLSRSMKDGSSNDTFTVRIMNRPGLAEHERIPKNRQPFIVTNVPRKAIQFSSKLYTSDQHLETAFRHEIELDVFPTKWKDLA